MMFLSVSGMAVIGTVERSMFLPMAHSLRQLAVGELHAVLQEHRFCLAGRKASSDIYTGAIFVKSAIQAESVSMAKGSQ
jgi:hypothetical protein